MNTEAETKKRTLKSILIGDSPVRTLVRTIIIACILIIIGRFVFLPVRVRGISMIPTYGDKAFTLINCLSYTFSEPKRGDIVAIRLSGKSVMFLKRVLGVPGDTVEFRKGILYINSIETPEPYIQKGGVWDLAPRQVNENELFVTGDNRSMSIDEHEMGIVDLERIVGQPLF